MVEAIDDLLREKETSNFFYLLIGLLALLSILFVMGGDDGLPFILARIAGFIIVILIAYNLIEWTSNVTESTEHWIEKANLDEDINLRVQDISELLERASEGKEMSQDILHERIKKIFFLKFKDVEEISDNELNDLVKKPEKFRKAVKDEVIADFILSTEEKQKKRRSLRGASQKKYKSKIKDIIQRIDEWEERYHG